MTAINQLTPRLGVQGPRHALLAAGYLFSQIEIRTAQAKTIDGKQPLKSKPKGQDNDQ